MLTVDDIAKLVQGVAPYVPPSKAIENAVEGGFIPKCDYDIGSESFGGKFFAQEFGEYFRYAHDESIWYRFNGKTWEADVRGDNRQAAKVLPSKLKKLPLASEQFEELKKLEKRCGTDAGIGAVLRMARTEDPIRVTSTDFDRAETLHLLSCNDGVIDLRTNVREAHSPRYLLTKHLDMRCNSLDEPEMFMKFLRQTFAEESVVQWVLNFMGYCLSGETWWQHFVMWIGPEGTGKSQLQKIFSLILGAYCGNIDADSLLARKERSAATDSDLADIRGNRVVFSSELHANAKLDERVIKALTGDGHIRAKKMGKDRTTVYANAKLIFTANDRPPLSDDGAIARRLCEVRFERPPTEIIDQLAEKIFAREKDQILGLAVDRCAAVYADHSLLAFPKPIQQWTRQYIEEADTVRRWLEECVLTSEGMTPTRDLFESFEKWCQSNHLPMDLTVITFGRRMQKHGYMATSNGRQKGWKCLLRAV